MPEALVHGAITGGNLLPAKRDSKIGWSDYLCRKALPTKQYLSTRRRQQRSGKGELDTRFKNELPPVLDPLGPMDLRAFLSKHQR